MGVECSSTSEQGTEYGGKGKATVERSLGNSGKTKLKDYMSPLEKIE